MAGKFHHEALYRGQAELAKLAAARVTVCGAGALGSHLADNLVRQGVATGGAGHLRLIDHDRVEEHNVSTQAYGESDVGVFKVEAMRNRLFRAAGAEIDAVRKQLTPANARQLLKDCHLVLDGFDNAASRQAVQEHCRAAEIPCLHAGLYEDYCEVVWDEQYHVPRDVAGDVCDYPLARNLVLLTVAIASEAVVRYLLTGQRQSWSATLGDFAVRPYEPPDSKS